ncbi:MAG: alpha/beta fold hydrolase [Actinophytocola sp.]|nr:alpha/beta fold hydrolase [Actinophytocola sp.]
MTSTQPVATAVLDVPGAHLYYEVRGSGPLVVLVGAPMGAQSFAGLADLLATDHTVLTTDPRGINRSTVDDPDADATPEQRGDDLARLITHLDAGPSAVLGSSGGAVSTLALVQAHPEVVRTAIAHEPPLQKLVGDHERLRELTEDYLDTYFAGDVLGSWRKFLDMADIAMPEELIQQIFGGPRDPQQVADDDFQNAHMLRPTSFWRPDIDALRAASTRIVIGIGDESTGQLCDRTSRALAELLSIEPTPFPGDHIGFAEDPAAFAPPLRAVLAGG